MAEQHRWSPYRPPGQFLLPVPVDPEGRTGPTPNQARGPLWRRTGSGYYVPATVDGSRPTQRVAEAAVGLPPGSALTGWASLHLHGAAFFDGVGADGRTRLAVPVRVPPQVHPRRRHGIRFIRGPGGRDLLVRGLPVTPVRTALLDSMRLQAELREAVVDMDMVAAARLTTTGAMQELVESRPSWRGVPGIPLVREALALASEHSRSPQETRLRLVWLLDAGLPSPLVNQPVFDRSGRLLGYPDLLDVEAGLVVEYDGDDHRSAARHSDDVDREARFRGHGLEVTRATGRDIRNRSDLANRLLEARRRARFESPVDRRWTVL